MLETYKKMDITDVNITSGISKLVERELVTLHIKDGIKIQAYYAPQFESNIISVKMLSYTFEILLLYHIKD